MTADTPKRPSRQAEERRIMADPALRGLMGVIEALRDMPPQMARTLFLVAARPGISLGELGVAVGSPQSTTSRNLQALGDGSSRGAVGMRLVEARTDPRDFRVKVHYLTAEGRAFVLRLLGNLHDGQPRPEAPAVLTSPAASSAGHGASVSLCR